jgi:hypothetical protein
VWWYTSIIPDTEEASTQAKARPFLKNKLKQKRAGGVAQVVESLLSKCKELRSNSSTAKIIINNNLII